MNYTGPKVKLSRKIGIALTPKAIKYMEKRPYPPGVHGKAGKRRRISDYKKQLMEKQKLKLQYNVSERQMVRNYQNASRLHGSTPGLLVQLLEQRLDALVLRAGFARSIYAARQYVVHRHLLVDGKKVNIPAYKVKPGQVVSVKSRSKKLSCFHDALKTAPQYDYLDVNKPGLQFKFLRMPDREEIPVICDAILVVEFYSR